MNGFSLLQYILSSFKYLLESILGPKQQKNSKDCAKAKVSKSTLKVPTPSEQHWATPRTRTLKSTKQESSTSTNAYTSTAPVPTLGNLADPWGKESRNISRPPPPYTFTAPPKDIPWTPTNLTLSTRW